MNRYQIVAWPDGRRTVVSTLWANPRREADMAFVARMAGVTPGTEAEGIISHARVQARVRGEYVDVYNDRGCIAIVGPDGAVGV
jgi:hypothetical protein